jgi:hypothetical protein
VILTVAGSMKGNGTCICIIFADRHNVEKFENQEEKVIRVYCTVMGDHPI